MNRSEFFGGLDGMPLATIFCQTHDRLDKTSDADWCA